MNIKRIIFIMLLLLCICITGCDSDSTDGGTAATDTVVIKTAGDIQSVDDFSGDLNYEYVFETDCQTDLPQFSGMVYTPDGYYKMITEYDSEGEKRHLTFYDYATGQLVYVCGKSNCSHNDSNCDAYFDENTFPMHYLWYYDGNLYLPTLDEDYVCICKVSLDGSTRENVCRVQRLNIEEEKEPDGSISKATYYPILQLHRGYVYYSTAVGNSGVGELGRVKLYGTGEPETICKVENKDYGYGIYRIKPYGRYIFFQMSYYDSSGEYMGNIYVYDAETSGGIMKVCDDCICDYTLFNGKLYYCDMNNDVYEKDTESGETRLFFDLDTENKYSFNLDNTLSVYDGHLVCRIYDIDNYEYDEETDTFFEYIYQLFINSDGELEKTLYPEDEKVYPYG